MSNKKSVSKVKPNKTLVSVSKKKQPNKKAKLTKKVVSTQKRVVIDSKKTKSNSKINKKDSLTTKKVKEQIPEKVKKSLATNPVSNKIKKVQKKNIKKPTKKPASSVVVTKKKITKKTAITNSNLKTKSEKVTKTINENNFKEDLQSSKSKGIQIQIIICLLVMILGILALLITFTVRSIKDKSIEQKPNSLVEDIPIDVKKLYKIFSDVNCNGAYTWHFNKSNILKVDEMSKNDQLNLIFSKLFQEGYLNYDKISFEKYETTALKLFGNNYQVSKTIKDFTYRGYEYTLKEDIISRKLNICMDGIEYISNLDSYNVEGKVLHLYVNVGYVLNSQLYNANGRLIAEYNKETLKSNLKSATRYLYTFEKENGNYILKSVGIIS